jgi:hypothetical protein
MVKQEFKAVIKRYDPGWHYIDMPFDVRELFGHSSRVPVNASVDGFCYNTSLIPGADGHYMVISQEMREATGKVLGDTLSVMLDTDDKPREIAVPADIQQALRKNAVAFERFTALAYAQRKRYTEWIKDAKKPETRVKRIARLVEELSTEEKENKK